MNEGYELTLLERTAAQVAYPVTPQLRARVLAAVAQPAPRPAGVRAPRLAPVFAAVVTAAAIVGGAIALGVPASRSAIAEFFGVEGSKVETLPTPGPGATATPFPPGTELPPGAREATLDEIESALGVPAGLPGGREPDVAYLVQYEAEPVAIMRYAGYDIWQARPRPGVIFAKGVPAGTPFLEITVGGGPAYFIGSGPHTVVLLDQLNRRLPGSERTVTRNTLVFNTGYALYRIETSMPRSPELIELAESLP
jgi:hypothetical protein